MSRYPQDKELAKLIDAIHYASLDMEDEVAHRSTPQLNPGHHVGRDSRGFCRVRMVILDSQCQVARTTNFRKACRIADMALRYLLEMGGVPDNTKMRFKFNMPEAQRDQDWNHEHKIRDLIGQIVNHHLTKI